MADLYGKLMAWWITPYVRIAIRNGGIALIVTVFVATVAFMWLLGYALGRFKERRTARPSSDYCDRCSLEDEEDG